MGWEGCAWETHLTPRTASIPNVTSPGQFCSGAKMHRGGNKDTSAFFTRRR